MYQLCTLYCTVLYTVQFVKGTVLRSSTLYPQFYVPISSSSSGPNYSEAISKKASHYAKFLTQKKREVFSYYENVN
jgi:hypothetical protein